MSIKRIIIILSANMIKPVIFDDEVCLSWNKSDRELLFMLDKSNDDDAVVL